MDFWDLICSILAVCGLIVVAAICFVYGFMPIFFRCKRLFHEDVDAEVWENDEELLKRFGTIGSIIYVVFDALLAGFFTFLPLYVMGATWQTSTGFAFGTMACKGAMDSGFYRYVVGVIQIFLWLKTIGDIVSAPVNPLSIVYYITVALFVVTMIIPEIAIFVRPYIKRKS